MKENFNILIFGMVMGLISGFLSSALLYEQEDNINWELLEEHPNTQQCVPTSHTKKYRCGIVRIKK